MNVSNLRVKGAYVLEARAVLFAQARVHCDNKPRQIGLNHDYNMTFSISPRECQYSPLKRRLSCSKWEPFRVLLPLLRHVVPLNDLIVGFYMVRQQKTWFDTKKHGSTQKNMVRHKNTLLSQIFWLLLLPPPPPPPPGLKTTKTIKKKRKMNKYLHFFIFFIE